MSKQYCIALYKGNELIGYKDASYDYSHNKDEMLVYDSVEEAKADLDDSPSDAYEEVIKEVNNA